jgi:hypothetical protein
MNSVSRWIYARRFAPLCLAFTAALWSLNFATAQSFVQFTLKEVGEGQNTSVELEFSLFDQLGVSSLTSPNGNMFQASTALEHRDDAELLTRFSSLSEALAFVTGTWHGKLNTFPFQGQMANFEFTVASISEDAVYRGNPRDISLGNGSQIGNGIPFELSWNYGTDVSEHKTFGLLDPQFGSMNLAQTFIVMTPDPNGSSQRSGRRGVGNSFFKYDIRNLPGTSENRFLTSLTAADAMLPLEVEFSLGAYTSLSTYVSAPISSDPFRNPQFVFLHYVRLNEPIRIEVVPVAEPVSAALAPAMIAGLLALVRGRNAYLTA